MMSYAISIETIYDAVVAKYLNDKPDNNYLIITQNIKYYFLTEYSIIPKDDICL